MATLYQSQRSSNVNTNTKGRGEKISNDGENPRVLGQVARNSGVDKRVMGDGRRLMKEPPNYMTG